MVTSGVVWCLKNDRWVPLQLSSIRLHGVLTQAHWAAVSKFLQQVANKQLVLQENGFTELTEQQKEVLLLQQHVKTGLDCNNKTSSESGAELKKTDDKLIENEDDVSKSKIETPCINVEEVKQQQQQQQQQQWHNVVIEENGVLQILNNNGKTEIDSSQIESQSNVVNSLIKIPEQSIVSDGSRIFTLNFEQPVNKSLEQISSTDSKDCDNHRFQEVFPSNDINNSNVDRNNCNLFIDNLLQETDNSKNVSIIGRFTIEQNEDSTNDPNSNDNNSNDNLNKTDRKNSTQSDEIVLRLLRKYSKYSRDALDDEILNAIDSFTIDNNNSPRSRKMSVIHKEEKLYENCSDFCRSSFHEENFENERNEHLMRWLKQQSKQKHFWDTRENNRKLSLPCPDNKTSSWGVDTKKSVTTESSPTDRRKSCITFKSHSRKSSVSSAFESRKSSANSSPDSRKSSISSPSISDSGKFSDFESRKNSVTSNSSCSESEESGTITTHWQKILKKHIGSKNLEKKLKKQREAWARNTRKLSLGSDAADLTLQS
ncbi:hypothetical protein ILUMI_03180, partial [Ignelater luminosus]